MSSEMASAEAKNSSTVVVEARSASSQPTSRRSQSDGSAEITTANQQRPANGNAGRSSLSPNNDRRRRSHSACDDRASQLKAKIDARFEQLEKEMKHKRESFGLSNEDYPPRALLLAQKSHSDQPSPVSCDNNRLPPTSLQLQNGDSTAVNGDSTKLNGGPAVSLTNGGSSASMTSQPTTNGSVPSSNGVVQLNCAAFLLSPDTPTGDKHTLCDSYVNNKQPRGSVTAQEFKEHANHRLEEELAKLQSELRLKGEEVEKLRNLRDEVGAELEDLTASLFEEANKMVQNANIETAQAQKRLKEALLKNDGLSAEVEALKTLVITSTPSMPNPHLHPHIAAKNNGFDARLNANNRSNSPAVCRSPANRILHNGASPGTVINSPTMIPISCSMNELSIAAAAAAGYHGNGCHNNHCVSNNGAYYCYGKQDNGELPDYYQLAIRILEAIQTNSVIIEDVSNKSSFPNGLNTTSDDQENSDEAPQCALLEAHPYLQISNETRRD